MVCSGYRFFTEEDYEKFLKTQYLFTQTPYRWQSLSLKSPTPSDLIYPSDSDMITRSKIQLSYFERKNDIFRVHCSKRSIARFYSLEKDPSCLEYYPELIEFLDLHGLNLEKIDILIDYGLDVLEHGNQLDLAQSQILLAIELAANFGDIISEAIATAFLGKIAEIEGRESDMRMHYTRSVCLEKLVRGDDRKLPPQVYENVNPYCRSCGQSLDHEGQDCDLSSYPRYENVRGSSKIKNDILGTSLVCENCCTNYSGVKDENSSRYDDNLVLDHQKAAIMIMNRDLCEFCKCLELLKYHSENDLEMEQEWIEVPWGATSIDDIEKSRRAISELEEDIEIIKSLIDQRKP